MDRNENRDVIEINFKRILYVLWRRLWAILLVGAIFGAAAISYALFFITPTYSAKAQLYVNNNYVGSPGFSSSQISAAQSLADTYMVIMLSHNVLDDVVENTGLGYTYGQIRNMVSAASVNETEVFEVRVTCTNYKHAAIIANAIADVLPDKIAAVVEGSSVRVVDKAIENPNPVGPNHTRYLVVGFMLGAMLTAMIIVVADILDKSITSEEYLRQAYADVPLLAVIPFDDGNKYGYHKGYRHYRNYYTYTTKNNESNKRGGAAK